MVAVKVADCHCTGSRGESDGRSQGGMAVTVPTVVVMIAAKVAV